MSQPRQNGMDVNAGSSHACSVWSGVLPVWSERIWGLRRHTPSHLFAELDHAMVGNAQERFGQIPGSFRAASGELSELGEWLCQEGRVIGNKVADGLVALQFQDRTKQIQIYTTADQYVVHQGWVGRIEVAKPTQADSSDITWI